MAEDQTHLEALMQVCQQLLQTLSLLRLDWPTDVQPHIKACCGAFCTNPHCKELKIWVLA